ncbi:ABC transporter substrate-binding protein [Streptomyces sp. NPDC048659]|uniref:protein kinase domain-containing protein n=1 Tax=Streptomyces sp. NPDC048659 TaxID=3155489 RepID=UPI003448BD84
MSPTPGPGPQPDPEPRPESQSEPQLEPRPESGERSGPGPAPRPASPSDSGQDSPSDARPIPDPRLGAWPTPAPRPAAPATPPPPAAPATPPAVPPATPPLPAEPLPTQPPPGALQPLLSADPSALAGYRLLGRLGAGGMGVVYLGRTGTGELAAVKVTHADRADQADFRSRFRREVEAARRVDSPWAVPVTGADPDAPEPWMATAFVPGPSLGEAVRAHGPLPGRSVRILGAGVARALAAVHAAGIVHRDVKPGNVLLAVDGPRLIDFGIARAAGETGLTSADVVVGTPGFLAPEQAAARTDLVGPPADVFALGCLLAYAATGRPPFGGGTADALLYRTVHDRPDLAGVPEDLLPLLTACLAKAPAARPTAAELATRLAEGTGTAEARQPSGAPAARPTAAELANRLAEGTGTAKARQPSGAPPARPTAAELATRLAEGTGTAKDRQPSGDGDTAFQPPADWLPAPVIATIAERSAAMLALPDIDATLPAPGTGPAPKRSRRAFLALGAGAAVLAAGGGGYALWDSRRGGRPAAPASPTWTVGVLADLSGPAQEIGRAQERGARLAVEAFNARAKGEPFTLALKVADDRGDRATALATARKLTSDPSLIVTLGPTSDDTGEAALPAFEESGVPLLTTSAGYNLLTLRGAAGPPNTTVLRAVPNHLMAGTYLAWAVTLLPQVRRPGVLQERTDDQYSWQYVKGVGFGFKQAGITPHYRVIPGRVTDYRTVLGEMIDAGIDAYVHCGVRGTAVLAARALKELGFTGPRFTGQRVFGDGFLKQAGDAAEGWFLGAPVVDPVQRAADPKRKPADRKPAQDFLTAYRKRFGTDPAYYSGESFDVVNLALGWLSSRAVKAPLSREGLWQALRDRQYDGAMGGYAFGDNGELKGVGTFLFGVQGGAYTFLGAAPSEPVKAKNTGTGGA